MWRMAVVSSWPFEFIGILYVNIVSVAIVTYLQLLFFAEMFLRYVFVICSVKKEHNVHINAGIDC